MNTITLNVTGMKCQHCVQNVSKALNALNGVTASVSLEGATATIESNNNIDPDTLIAIIQAAGYQATVKG